MTTIDFTPQLFGLDLRNLFRDWKQAILLMGRWPGFRWLSPQYAVTLKARDGLECQVLEDLGVGVEGEYAPDTPFRGLLIPEELVLWRQWSPPELSEPELAAALELEVQRLNPFEPEELIWLSRRDASGAAHGAIHIALTSRKLLKTHMDWSPDSQLELWVKIPETDAYTLFSGFGERRRYQASLKWLLVNFSLILLILAVGVLAALTPSLQLRERAHQASADFERLKQQSGKVLALREQLLKEQSKVQQLQALAGNRMIPENVLLLVTKYLPDDTYVLVIDVKGSTVNLTGLTSNAASLMQHLGKQPGVKKVTAPNAARRERDRETFNIEFDLDAVAIAFSAAVNASEPTTVSVARHESSVPVSKADKKP